MKKVGPYLLLVLGLSGPIVFVLGRWHWLPDAFSHFCLQYHGVMVVCAVFLGLMKQWVKAALLAVVFLTLFTMMLLPYYYHSGTSPALENSKPSLSVFYANVYTENTAHEKLAVLLEKNPSDIAVFLEVGQKWDEYLEESMNDYPYRKTIAREDNFGISLYSKIPLEIEERTIGRTQVPSFRAALDFNNSKVVLWLTHPLPPVGYSYWSARNDQLREIAKEIKKETQPVILVGDLNTSPWSYWFKKFVKETALFDTALGRGVKFTWPTMWPSVMRTAIDHILVSADIDVKKRAVLSSFDSDHLPIYAELILPD